jgi:hypothetical protein
VPTGAAAIAIVRITLSTRPTSRSGVIASTYAPITPSVLEIAKPHGSIAAAST